MKRALLLLCVVLSATACDNGAVEEAAPSPSPVATEGQTSGVTFSPGKALIDTDEGSVLLDVELAENEEQRQQGLMFRESLDEDSGMLFTFFEEASPGGFWMKNTLIPLSIAFIDTDSKIVAILDMEPCQADPCPVYDPGLPYAAALEVNQGAFDEWGVETGDRVTVTR